MNSRPDVAADVTAHRPSPGAFDLVVLAYLHLPPPSFRTVLAASTSALASGGVLLVIGHDITNLTEGHGGPQDPAVLYGPDDVVAGLRGLAIDKAERVRRPVVTERGTVDAIDVLVRAHRP
jgi:hypothetical protein